MPNVSYLTPEQVLYLHDQIIQETGGSHGVRDPDGLLSAIGRPSSGVADQEFYPTLFDKAAALLESLISNHPFVDGNKRTGMAAAGIFLELNGWMLDASQKELEDFAVSIANHGETTATISVWLRQYSQQL